MTLPALPGLGFKHEHFPDIRETCPDVGFFEVHAENYMGDGGAPHAMLTALRADYEISVHGVGLSIGGTGPLDAAHLLRLKKLCDRYEPASFLRGFNDMGRLVPYAMIGLAARVFPAVVFWQSGRTKMDTIFHMGTRSKMR
ncbi:DUF692 family protein [Paracoccus sp. 11-3]|uniref:DUF692 family protein n=1 Tax=Paracoccus amoyensis TaxID=2760093 RepID=A0A926JCH4_9RHOB|nr:DUF692 family protein [Paracoccus amoyensis]